MAVLLQIMVTLSNQNLWPCNWLRSRAGTHSLEKECYDGAIFLVLLKQQVLCRSLNNFNHQNFVLFNMTCGFLKAGWRAGEGILLVVKATIPTCTAILLSVPIKSAILGGISSGGNRGFPNRLSSGDFMWFAVRPIMLWNGFMNWFWSKE